MQIKSGIWLAILLASHTCALALDPSLDISQYAHTAWKTHESFVRGPVNSVAQTPDSYLWLATSFGLLRFDGTQARPWPPSDGNQLFRGVSQLLVARDGTLWIGTGKGLASWKDGKLSHYPEMAGLTISSLIQDSEGTVWVGSHDRGRLCAIRGKRIHCDESGSFGGSIGTLYEDHKGNLWVSARSGLWRWSPGPPDHYILSGGTVEASALIDGDHGELLIATSLPGAATTTGSIEGLQQLVNGKIQKYAIPRFAQHFRPKCLFRSSDGSLWIGTVQGLLHFHQGRIDKFSASDGLSGDVVTGIYEDREGNVWVNTEGGLDLFREYAVPTISAKQGLSSSSVHLVEVTSDGSIWIGTADGLDRWQNGHVAVYGRPDAPDLIGRTDQREISSSSTVTEITNSGLPGTPRSLGQDDRGRLLVSTREGVFIFESGRFTRLPDIPGGDIYALTGDGHGGMWISNNLEGLFHTTPENAVQRIPWARLGHNDPAVALLPDRLGGGLWLGFFDGGVAYLKDGEVRAFYNTVDGLGSGLVMALESASDGAVWVGTEGGLSRIKDERVTTLTSKNGLPCTDIDWVMEDHDHALWLATGCGLARISHSDLDAWVTGSTRNVQPTVFDDGVSSLGGHYHPKVAQSPDGRLWFASQSGLSIVNPQRILNDKLPPPVHIEQITADGERYDASPGLHLPPHTRDLAIDYTALNFAAPERTRFRFKLDGQDPAWREVGNQRTVEYSNLPPGNYRFHVIACNSSGVWNEQGDELDFAIAPAYYQNNWFRMLCVLTVLAMLFTVYQLRVQALSRRQAEIGALNEQLIKAQEAERMRIAGELHDGVLQQITSLTLELGTVKYQVPPDSPAKTAVIGLQEKLIKIGTEVRHLSHELHPVLLQEAGLSAALLSYCEEFSKVRGIHVSCEADEIVKGLSAGAALCIYRVAQEALGNAAKHAQAKKVEVRLIQSDGHVRLLVSDDGVGCTPDQVGKSGGLGVINMRERVLQLDGTFEFDSEPERGTRVKVSVPFRSGS
jgi:signal transduction histidine kinase